MIKNKAITLVGSLITSDVGEFAGWCHDCQPFTPEDLTGGVETELQTAVLGSRNDVDLPLLIEQSNYFANIIKRSTAGDLPRRALTDLERYLDNNRDGVWENSWVRFPRHLLSSWTADILNHDLLADKENPAVGSRHDLSRYTVCRDGGEELIRVPMSYLLKLALVEAAGNPSENSVVAGLCHTWLMHHFINDNTSPETTSFYVVSSAAEGVGAPLARENSRRYLLTQLLSAYANQRFDLVRRGQECIAYLAPHPPLRQKILNGSISDAFYRELFMSPCLSGWRRGEEKASYMSLCHQALSRSQLHCVAKLREAGIINHNLVVLPNVSNTSLANNGTHISLGSRCLSTRLAAGGHESQRAEKKFSDLVVKFIEHFLPLFVGAYSAAPYRLAFEEFHPESVLGFLPHELDYTHLRMFWRRWKKKAGLSFLGRPLTPFGPLWLDRLLAAGLRLKGDWVADYRLIDYLVSPLSTDRSPAFDGSLGSQERLKKDLAALGVFDESMALYVLCRPRTLATHGYCGFEGRHYSLFDDLDDDLKRSANLQALLTAVASQMILNGSFSHRQVPDDPVIESERRQIFFGAAAGLPTFYVHRNSGNRFLANLLVHIPGVRNSRRYPGYWRVGNQAYRLALIDYLRREAPAQVEQFAATELLDDLQQRLLDKDYAVAGRLTKKILGGCCRSPLQMKAAEFNDQAELFYRQDLRQQHFRKAWRQWENDCHALEKQAEAHREIAAELQKITGPDGLDVASFLRRVEPQIRQENGDVNLLERLIRLLMLTIYLDRKRFGYNHHDIKEESYLAEPSIHRAANQ
ncbi:MAG: hypothetical protein JXO49_12740 [Deltaproteobacteria bacterium]|nr:hypothetical protein [Candidatus Anaeroferrophillus wilburensis]MBN2890196.1 hypothetical protein [Deltaproteobacteria bacterium]